MEIRYITRGEFRSELYILKLNMICKEVEGSIGGMRKKIIFVLIICVLTSCAIKHDKPVVLEEKPDKLIVYAIGSHVTDTTEPDKSYYFTSYTIGPFGPLANGITDQGYVFFDAFRGFEREIGIDLEIVYFRTMSEIEKQLREDKQNGTMPDIIICNQIAWDTYPDISNMYRAMANGWFLDVLPYMEEDGIYIGGEYYNEVLEAGQWEGHQYVIPLCFNLNAIFTSEEDMAEIGIWIDDEMTNAELLQQLEYACVNTPKGTIAVDTLTLYSCPPAFIQGYWETTGLSVADYDEGKATIDRELFEEVAVFFKQYLQMNLTEDWDTVLETAETYMQKDYWGAFLTPGQLETLDENKYRNRQDKVRADGGYAWMESGSFFLEENSISARQHSLPGQCVALSTIYEDLNEEMVVIGVPMQEDENSYMAQVQIMGGVVAESEHPYYSYQLLKYLMDREYDPYYTIPVKKENAEKMLDKLASTTFNLYLGLGPVWYEDVDFMKELEDYQYLLDPLTEDMRMMLENMLDNIGGATLPQFSAYEAIVWHMEAYAFEMETLDEAYENACKELQENLDYILSGEAIYEGV